MKVLEIISDDLEFNIKQIKNRANGTKIIGVVKGNGYGLGLEKFTKFLLEHGIKDFAVSSVEEAIELKSFGLDITILCLEATTLKEDLEILMDNDITISIGSIEAAKILNDLAKEKNKKVKVHLKIDTGFSRYGISYKDKKDILEVIKMCTSLYIEGVYSHFSTAYFKNDKFVNIQFSRFLEVKKYIENNNIKIPMYHICNSSAFLRHDEMFLDAVRIGSAFLGRIIVENKIGLKKIGMLKSKIVSIKKIEKKATVGYGNSYKMKKNSNIAIVPVGYADGINVGTKNDTFKFIDKVRILKNSLLDFIKDNRLYAFINNKKYLIVGKIGMNHIAINIGNEKINVGDEVKIDIAPIFVNNKIEREFK